jgi:uncharacterized coiled-coil protein SlyX
MQKMTNEQTIIIPAEYKEKSKQIEQLWEVFLETGENLDRVILETRQFLEDLGLSRTDAMKKIAADHRHLKGFSIATIYRMLPVEEKRAKQKQKQEPKAKDNYQNDNYTTVPDVPEIPTRKETVVDVESIADKYKDLTLNDLKNLEKAEIESEQFQRREQEYKDKDTLLQEVRAKLDEFEMRHERDETRILKLVDDVTEREKLLYQQADQIQELSKKLTNLSTTVIDTPQPAGEQQQANFSVNYDLNAEVIHPNCPKLPLEIRCYPQTRKVVAWIDETEFKRRRSKS